jgi:hypothetical protein
MNTAPLAKTDYFIPGLQPVARLHRLNPTRALAELKKVSSALNTCHRMLAMPEWSIGTEAQQQELETYYLQWTLIRDDLEHRLTKLSKKIARDNPIYLSAINNHPVSPGAIHPS